MKEYIIIEQGTYSDYGVSIVDITNCPLTLDEIYTVLKIDSHDTPQISGKIKGEIKFYDNSSLGVKDLKKEIESKLNCLFCCYSNRVYKTVLDKLYTEEECLKIAITNDSSGEEFWQREIRLKYNDYKEGFAIYNKLIPPIVQS